jgi:hypothetical protein
MDGYIILSKDDFEEDENTVVAPVEVLLALLERSDHNL